VPAADRIWGMVSGLWFAIPTSVVGKIRWLMVIVVASMVVVVSLSSWV
jgi:hypothetical protein